MVERFVVDASALAKLFRNEPESASLRAWFAARVAAHDRLESPSLIRFELGELIRGKEKVAPAEQSKILEFALDGLTVSDASVSAAFEFGKSLTFYDASYLALAKDLGATLVTYDSPLLRQAVAFGCPVLAPGR